MQLDIILTSLQDHTHVASLLGYSSPSDAADLSSVCTGYGNLSDQPYGTQSCHPDTHLAEILMKTLLRNLGFYTVRCSFFFVVKKGIKLGFVCLFVLEGERITSSQDILTFRH